MRIFLLSISAATPPPEIALNPSTMLTARFFSLALLTIAFPSGCSLPDSAEAAICKMSSRAKRGDPELDCFVVSLLAMTSVTVAFPLVIVPVLSRIIALTSFMVWRAAPFLIRMPFSAPMPEATIKAVGVARPKAQGQAITRTDMAAKRAWERGEANPSFIIHGMAGRKVFDREERNSGNANQRVIVAIVSIRITGT